MAIQVTLADAVTTTGIKQSRSSITDGGLDVDAKAFQVAGQTSSGSGATTVNIEVSNDGTNFLVAGTISLTLGVSATSDGIVINGPWTYFRANVTALSGTGAAVTVTMAA